MSVDAPQFAVSESNELLALWRLVAEAKFQPNPEDPDLWGSPYVHALARNIAKALLSSYEAQGDAAAVEAHKRWVSSLPNNIVLPTVRSHLKRDAASAWWSEQSEEQKLEYVRGCIAPFEVDEGFLKGLIIEAEA
jgi:hypothetical protein